MQSEIATGLFTIAGTIVGGVFTYLAARVGQRWDKARSDIKRLCEQVAAYHKLEELYKQRVAQLDPSGVRSKTVQQDMRDQVQDLEGYERPTMTANSAREILGSWS